MNSKEKENRLTKHDIKQIQNWRGKSMKQIAADLGIGIQTCSKHRARIMEKMNVDNDVELVRALLTAQHDDQPAA